MFATGLRFDELIPLFLAFGVTAALLPLLIPVLTRLKVGQTEREEGVQSHLKKAGTPTMGGLAILAGVAVVSIIFVWRFPRILPVMILTIGFGLIGFLDDYLKVVLHRSDGLMPRQKLLGQFGVTAVFLFVLLRVTRVPLDLAIPFAGDRMIRLGWLGIPFAFLVILATVNGVNFTDGLDGLASSVTVVVAIFFFCMARISGAGADLSVMALAVAGSLLGFLLFNAYPAKVFMGDTGSLALGGFVAGCAYVLQMPLYIPIIGFIYTAELLSVVIQVSYFKATHGKRIFKMTPIHHHFELCGWSETRIVTVFTAITVLLCMAALVRA